MFVIDILYNFASGKERDRMEVMSQPKRPSCTRLGLPFFPLFKWVQNFITGVKMKVIYYKGLITHSLSLTPTERILYSFLLRFSINNSGLVFDEEDGTYISDALEGLEDIPVIEIKNQIQLAMKLKIMSQGAISLAYQSLKDKGIIDVGFDTIKLNNLPLGGYFELQVESNLRGELLIFYSWLKDLGKGRPISAKMKRLAELYGGMPMANIRDYLFRLRSKGLIERDEKNNLIVK